MTAAPRLTVRKVQGLRGRVRAIREMIRVGLRDPEMRQVGLAVGAGDTWTLRDFASRHGYRPLDLSGLRACRPRDDECELRNVFALVKNNARYTGDIVGVDTYVSARRTLFDFRGGDCDDATIAVETLIGELGFRGAARAVAVERDGAGNPIVAHIYAIAIVPKDRPMVGVAMDTTLPNASIGQEARHIYRVDYPLP